MTDSDAQFLLTAEPYLKRNAMHRGSSLFDSVPLPAATGDPETSRQAARAITADGTRQRDVTHIVGVVDRCPGRTSLELSRVPSCRLDRHQCAKRLADAEHLGLVRKGAARKCSVSGKQAVTWFPVEQGGRDPHETDA